MAAAASDKARFYMEQSVPELQELSRKGIFSGAEITSIAQKRSEFEHMVNMPGASTPTVFARYATYEMNLDTLRKKRSARLGVKTTTYSGQKKVFNVLERGVRKFQGDMGLWMQYLEFCKHEKAHKKLSKALTQCLRLHPLKWELWVWAARHYVESQADMTTGRSYMQRGLRFCKNERNLWLQYAKLEMLYVAKIAARRQILGLEGERKEKVIDESHDPDADMIALPSVTAEDLAPETEEGTEAVDEKALQKLSSTPAQNGAIPEAIMETGMKHFRQDPLLAEQFFDLFADFADTPCTARLMKRAMEYLETNQERKNAQALLSVCSAKMLFLGVDAQTAEFPIALGKALQQLKSATTADQETQAVLASRSAEIFLPYLSDRENLDEAVCRVLDASVKRSIRTLKAPTSMRGRNPMTELVKKLRTNKKVGPELLAQYDLTTQEEG